MVSKAQPVVIVQDKNVLGLEGLCWDATDAPVTPVSGPASKSVVVVHTWATSMPKPTLSHLGFLTCKSEGSQIGW